MASRTLMLTCCAVRAGGTTAVAARRFFSSFVRPAGYAHVAGRAGGALIPPSTCAAHQTGPFVDPQAEGLMGTTLNRFYHRFAERVQ